MRFNNANIHLSELISYTLLAVSTVGTVFFLFYFDPVNYTILITEDKWGEYGASVCFGLTGVILLALSIRQGPFMQRASWVMIGLATILVAGEEISWGQRIFGIDTPEEIRAINLQGELTLHNLKAFEVINAASHKIAAYMILVWLIFSVVVTARMPRLREKIITFGVPLIPVHLGPIFLMAPFFFLFSPTAKAKEIGEMLLGLTLMMWAVDLSIYHGRTKRPRVLMALCVMSGVLFLAGAFAVTLDKLHSKQPISRLNLMASRDYPSFGLFDQAEIIYNYIYAHPDFIKVDTWLNHGEMLLKRGKQSAAFSVLSQGIKYIEAKDSSDVSNSENLRRLGTMLTMMGQSEQADARFRQAIELDRQNLDLVSEPNKKSELLWSVAETMKAQGDIASAVIWATEAKEMATTPVLRFNLEKWIISLEDKLDVLE